MNAPNDQYVIFKLDLARDLGGQLFVARVNFTRLQRATKRAYQSAAGGCDDVIERCCVWLRNLRADAVVLGNGPVHAKLNRLSFSR